MTTGIGAGAMIKKKAKKVAAKKAAKKESPANARKETNPAQVRKEVSKMVESEAVAMTSAVIGEGKKGQLATVKYLFEMANIYPPAPDGTQATEEEDCLAKMLLDRLKPPVKAQAEEEANRTTVVEVENGGEASTPETESDAALEMTKSET